jgi:phage terminase large subunit-like protein
LAAAYDIKGFAYDQWQANMLAQKLMERNLPMEEVPQNLFLSDGMKEVDALVADGRLWHDGNRCMTWMMGNVMAKTTEDERIKPVKSNPNDKFCKIDGPVALVMAMTLACRDQEKGGISDWLADPVAM